MHLNILIGGIKMNELKLLRMADVPEEQVHWLWHPYIPRGKLTIVQGDPGEGKTTFVLALVALLTTGKPVPGEDATTEPCNVIYQTAEDGLGDTVKPRLTTLGADCSRVLVIDESQRELSMSDERVESAIIETNAKLFVLDPIQAYLGSDVDMHRANEIRPIIKRLGFIAERNDCAIVLVGHMNKMQGAKSAYRGLGSIDFRAAARSVLVIGRSKDDSTVRIAAHDKSSLAPEGQAIVFELHLENGFAWRGYCDATAEDVLSGRGNTRTKTQQAEQLIRELLVDGSVPSEELFRAASDAGISERTVKIAKQNLGLVSVRDGNRWLSALLTESPESRG